jgi:hypothetical protein
VSKLRADAIFEEMFDIADSSPSMIMGQNGEYIDGAGIQHTRVMIDTRKWALARMNPKKYGEVVITQPDDEIQKQYSEKVVLFKSLGTFYISPHKLFVENNTAYTNQLAPKKFKTREDLGFMKNDHLYQKINSDENKTF